MQTGQPSSASEPRPSPGGFDLPGAIELGPLADPPSTDVAVIDPGDRTHLDRGPRPRSPWLIAVALIVVLVAGAVAAFVLLDDRASGPTVDTFDDAAPTVDGMEPSTNPLGVEWAVVSGGMSTYRGVMEGAPGSRDEPALAILDFGDHHITSVAASWRNVATGSGIVFRYQSPSYYWLLTAAPQYGSWNLYRRIAGETTYVENIAYSARDGNDVEVRFEADGVSVWIDGQPRRTIVDPLLVEEETVGVIIGKAGPEARVDTFEVTTE